MRTGMPRVDAATLATRLEELKYLEFIKMPHATAEDVAQLREHLPPKYAVLHCPTEGR